MKSLKQRLAEKRAREEKKLMERTVGVYSANLTVPRLGTPVYTKGDEKYVRDRAKIFINWIKRNCPYQFYDELKNEVLAMEAEVHEPGRKGMNDRSAFWSEVDRERRCRPKLTRMAAFNIVVKRREEQKRQAEERARRAETNPPTNGESNPQTPIGTSQNGDGGHIQPIHFDWADTYVQYVNPATGQSTPPNEGQPALPTSQPAQESETDRNATETMLEEVRRIIEEGEDHSGDITPEVADAVIQQAVPEGLSFPMDIVVSSENCQRNSDGSYTVGTGANQIREQESARISRHA